MNMLDAVKSALSWHMAQAFPTHLMVGRNSVSWFVPGGDVVVVKHDMTPDGILAALVEPETRKPTRVKREMRK